MDVVGQPVEQRAGQSFGGEDTGPFLERQVRGDDSRTAFMSLAECFEEKLSTSPGKRHVTEFIDDQQLDRRHLGLQPEQPALILGFHQLVDEAGGGREGDREAALAGRQAESQGDVGLAGTAVAERDDVLPRHDVFTAGQFEDQWLVQRRDGGEVEGLQGFDGGEPCGTDPSFHHAALAVDQFEFRQTQKVARMVEPLLSSLTCNLLVLAQEGRQLQLLQVVCEQHLRRAVGLGEDLRHAAVLDSSTA